MSGQFKTDVLDYGFVELITWMGNDLTVVNSARVSFSKRSEWDPNLAYHRLKPEDAKLINYLAAHNHWSPFRHVYFTFHCKVPEFVARQWYKHVVGIAYTEGGASTPDHGWNEVSLRYNDASAFDFYMPSEFRKQSESNRQASTGEIVEDPVYSLRQRYKDAIETSFATYQIFISSGMAKEQARAVLPLAIYTEFYWTCSLQALVNFIKLRKHEGAQWEIHQYAEVLEQYARQVCPVSVEALLK